MKKSIFSVLLCAAITLISPQIAQSQERVDFQLNGHPTVVYDIRTFADKVLIKFYDLYGPYSVVSFLELDTLSKTVKYTNSAANQTGLTAFVECSSSYELLPLNNADVNGVFGIEFTLPCLDNGTFRGILYWETVALPNGFVAPICDSAQETIAALETERTELETLVTNFSSQNSILKTENLAQKNACDSVINQLQISTKDTSAYNKALEAENLGLKEQTIRLKRKIKRLQELLRGN